MPALSLAQTAYTADLQSMLDTAVRAGSPGAITHAVKDGLIDLITHDRLHVPETFRIPRSDTYARRLLLEDRELGYQAIVMVWGVGQGTMLHDHAGIWCVEGVVEGQIAVEQYDLLDETADGRYRFDRKGSITTGVGSAGTLIPPYEYHTIANALPDRPAVTLHVYGGEMTHCGVFAPQGDGWYERQEKELRFSA